MLIYIGVSLIMGYITGNIARKKEKSFGLWFVLGVLCFIIALPAVLLSSDNRRTCPNCMSKINRKATVCPYCQSKLVPIVDEPANTSDFSDNFNSLSTNQRIGILLGLLLLVVVFALFKTL